MHPLRTTSLPTPLAPLVAAALFALLAAAGPPKGREVPLDAELPPEEEATAIRDAEVELQGSRLHLLEAGDPDGLPVLLLHGARFSAESWRELGTVTLLARQGYRVLALDLPGFGGSGSSKIPAGDFLAALVPLLTERPVVVVSPSMSGRFSLPFVTSRPAFVAGFVPIAPVGVAEHLDELRGSRMPTLIVWGENDRVVPTRVADSLARALPDSRKVILEEADHPCYLDRPIEFHRELLQFLARLRG